MGIGLARSQNRSYAFARVRAGLDMVGADCPLIIYHCITVPNRLLESGV